MELDKIIYLVLLGAGVLIHYFLFNIIINKTNGLTVVKYGYQMRFFSYLSILLPMLLCSSIMKTSPSEYAIATISIVLTISASMALILEMNHIEISYNDSFILTKSPWRKARKIPWDDVVSIEFSKLPNWYVVKTKQWGIIRLHKDLDDLDDFVKIINNRIDNRIDNSPKK